MIHHPRIKPLLRLSTRSWAALIACVLLTGCLHHRPAGPYVPPPPITIHVQSENYLDSNVYIEYGGVSRRLGLVLGNTKDTFTFPWNSSLTTGMTMIAQTVGGGTAQSRQISVGPGEEIDFRIAAELRQSVATVHDP